jgi:hypothetical protein
VIFLGYRLEHGLRKLYVAVLELVVVVSRGVVDEVDELVETRSFGVGQWPRRPIPPAGVDIHGDHGWDFASRCVWCLVVLLFSPRLEKKRLWWGRSALLFGFPLSGECLSVFLSKVGRRNIAPSRQRLVRLIERNSWAGVPSTVGVFR